MAVKSLHQFFYYHSKYLNSMKCRKISIGPSICTIQCIMLCTRHAKVKNSNHKIGSEVIVHPKVDTVSGSTSLAFFS